VVGGEDYSAVLRIILPALNFYGTIAAPDTGIGICPQKVIPGAFLPEFMHFSSII
jgi:hypothetical protein